MGIFRLSASELGDRLFAAGLLVLASMAVRLLPFRMLAKSAEWGRAEHERIETGRGAAERSAQAIKSAANRLPWRTVCIQQALALHWLLRWKRLRSYMHFGIRPGDDRLSAHVWVSFEGRILIGEDSAATHAQVAVFPSQG